MKKVLIIAAITAITTVGMMPVSASAGGFNVKKCKACHAVGKKKVGPAWDEVAKAYGDEATLAADFKAGFTTRKYAEANPKWKGKEGMMTGQFKKLIVGHEDEAAAALFAAVKAGKI